MHLYARLRTLLRTHRKAETLGQRGEALAARLLRRKGYKILARGHRDQLGELDLIAVDERIVVFVEVKTRQSLDKGHPSEAVDHEKQRRLTRLAMAYLKRHHLLECSARFDVVAILWPDTRNKPQSVEHFENAFEAVGIGQMHS